MTEVSPELSQLIGEWLTAKEKAAEAAALEMAMRREIFAQAFPTPVEGTNTLPLSGDGWNLKGTYKLNRKIDDRGVPAIREGLEKLGVSADRIFVPSFKFDLKAYRGLVGTPAGELVDQIMTTTPGAPALEIVAPKKD